MAVVWPVNPQAINDQSRGTRVTCAPFCQARGYGLPGRIQANDYARRSELKEISRAAVDVSDQNAPREAASQAENERRILELEQARLRGQPEAPATAR